MILRNLERDSVPEFSISRERKFWYTRNITFKLNKVTIELERMIALAKAKGLDESVVDSFYLHGEEALENFKRTNGLNLPINQVLGYQSTPPPA